MSNRDWMYRAAPLILALLIGALSAVAVQKRLYHAENSPRQEQETDSYTERAEQRILIECAGLNAAASAKCANEIISAAEQSYTAAQDLEQQTKMAVWAFWMMIASFGSILVTAIGVVYVRLTLDQTAAATKAANDAVAVTGRLGEAQVRAYMVSSTIWATPIKDVSGQVVALEFKAIFHNTGQSPATIKKLTIGFGFAADGQSINDGTDRTDFRTHITVGSGQSVNSAGAKIGIAAIRRSGGNNLAIIIIARCEYQDIFAASGDGAESRHVSKIAAKIPIDESITAMRNPQGAAVSFTYLEPN